LARTTLNQITIVKMKVLLPKGIHPPY